MSGSARNVNAAAGSRRQQSSARGRPSHRRRTSNSWTNERKTIIGSSLSFETYAVGDVVSVFQGEPMFRGDHGDHSTRTYTTDKGEVMMRGKFRPFVVVGTFPSHFLGVPMYTHGGRFLEAVVSKPKDREEAALLLDTMSNKLVAPDQGTQEARFPASKKLWWNHHGLQGVGDRAILYPDWVSTIQHEWTPAPQRIGKLTDDSAAKLCSLVRDHLCKGMGMGPKPEGTAGVKQPSSAMVIRSSTDHHRASSNLETPAIPATPATPTTPLGPMAALTTSQGGSRRPLPLSFSAVVSGHRPAPPD